MQHHIRWSREGWTVVTMIAGLVVCASVALETYTEALALYLATVGA